MVNKEINLTSSNFERHINNNHLYVDKTRFIEHFMRYPGEAILITRPRRMGKSLNLDMLRTFLDIKKDTRNLFRGLYIESSPCIDYINKFPVIYLDFKELSIDEYKVQIFDMLEHITENYLKEMEVNKELRKGLNRNSVSALKYLIVNIFDVYGIESIVIIDEYDNLVMRECNKRDAAYLRMLDFMALFLTAALKGNNYIYKALICGVTRISYEDMSSGLNNLKVRDVISTFPFDEDFGLTDAEITKLAMSVDTSIDMDDLKKLVWKFTNRKCTDV